MLEVIIALTIFCIAGLSIMKIISERLRWINILEQRMISDYGTWIYVSLIDKVIQLPISSSVSGNLSGPIENISIWPCFPGLFIW